MVGKKANKKTQFYKYLILILLLGGGLIFLFMVFVGKQQDIAEATQMGEETITFLKGICKRYDNRHLGLETDAKQNLLDKSQILKEYMGEDTLENDKELLKFVKLENLTGVLVVDKSLKTIAQADIRKEDAHKIWKHFLKMDRINNISKYSAKIFAEKIKIADATYYVAVVSRKDKEGLILCYQRADKIRTDKYDASFSSLLENNTFHKNPKIVITDGKNILATNAGYLHKVKRVKDMPDVNIKWQEHQVVKIKFQGTTLYGIRQVYNQYYIYVCYQSSEIFSNLVPIVTTGVAVYIFFLMGIILVHQNLQERNLMEQARQIQTIEAISTLYVSTALLNVKTKECTPIKYSERLKKILNDEKNGDKLLKILMDVMIAPDYKEEFEEFLNPEKIYAKMKQKKEFISYMYQDKKGQWFMTYIVPAKFDENEEVNTVLIATRDISDHQKKEIAYQEQLKKAAREAKLANASKTTFLRRMSHDIRTPINGIRGMATLAKHHLEEPGRESEYIDKIITSSDYLLDLVNDVLQMNKLESGKIYFESKSFDMRQLIKDIIEICKIQAEEQDVSLNLKEMKTEHSYLIGSPVHLRQIAQNLITNAIRYNRVGGTVDVTWKEIDFDGEKATYEFICADTGKGMSEEFQQHLFEPFAQENDNGRSTYSGTGLGLPIVKQLVQYMGGTIGFTSKKGKGTTFIITMKLPVDMNYKSHFQEDIDVETISIEGVKILLVEDNEINMQIARELLETNGAIITEATNGKEAIQIFESSKEGTFDIILMDIMMPVMDGLDATRYIRGIKREDAQNIPIFAMTANAFIEDVNQSKEAGMNEHFSKPLDMENVIKTICKYKKK